MQLCSEALDVARLRKAAQQVREFLESERLAISMRVFDTSIALELRKKSEDEPRFSKAEAEFIREKTNILFHAVMAEVLDRPIYAPTEKRYEHRKLLDEVSLLFAPNVFAELPDIARYDFKEACSCILFERNTAAAFHLLRGTEDLIRNFFVRLSGTSVLPANGTWGDIENALKSVVPQPPQALLEQLRHIRKNFRNPTQHPEKRYDSDEVQDLLNLCIDLANRIAKVD